MKAIKDALVSLLEIYNSTVVWNLHDMEGINPIVVLYGLNIIYLKPPLLGMSMGRSGRPHPNPVPFIQIILIPIPFKKLNRVG